MLAAKTTREWFDTHNLEVARVQSPGVCTQSVMSTVVICSNLMGCSVETMDAGRQGERKSTGRTRRPSTFKCMGYSCTHTMSALSTQRALPFSDSCQTNDTNLILRIENGPDRNYPC